MNKPMCESCDSEQTVLDLDALRARCLGNLDLVERVLSKFTGQVDADLNALERAVQAGDSATAAELAHRIKGMAANVEARSLSADASMAEQGALEGGTAALPSCVERMRRDQSKLTEYLEQHHHQAQ